MHIRTTTDPITLRDVPDFEHHPCLYEGDGEHGLEIYFENERTKKMYTALKPHDPLVLRGADSDDYVAEG
jgi:hypothetical protein